MKKLICCILAGICCIGVFSGCENSSNDIDTKYSYKVEDFVDFRCVANETFEQIYVDLKTGVCYYHYGTGFDAYYSSMMPIINMDGSPLLLSEVEEGEQ